MISGNHLNLVLGTMAQEVYKGWETCWTLIIWLLKLSVLTPWTRPQCSDSQGWPQTVEDHTWESLGQAYQTNMEFNEHYLYHLRLQPTLQIVISQIYLVIYMTESSWRLRSSGDPTYSVLAFNWMPFNYAALAFGFPCNQWWEIKGNSNHSWTLLIIELSWLHSYHRWFS